MDIQSYKQHRTHVKGIHVVLQSDRNISFVTLPTPDCNAISGESGAISQKP